MTEVAPYRIYEPQQLDTGAVFNSPHSGDSYPADLLAQSRLDALRLRSSEDALVDKLFDAAPRFGAPLLAATMPRAWLDLNRGAGELDPALIEGAHASGLNQRIAAGLGVVPRIVSEGTPIYAGKIPLDEAKRRIATVHDPYHRKLESLVMRARQRFGFALLYDCHSMPSEALRAAPRVNGVLPDVVLGDRFGASCNRELVAATQEAFRRAGFTVARNAPFAGGYITQRYGRPSRGLHAIQIEIDRALYMDQKRVEAHDGFSDVQSRLTDVVSELVGISIGPMSVAAE